MWSFEYRGENALVEYAEPCPQLAPVGVDDVVRSRVVVLGGLQYDTTTGGTATAIQFEPIGDPQVLANN